jgi:hypothetical protein
LELRGTSGDTYFKVKSTSENTDLCGVILERKCLDANNNWVDRDYEFQFNSNGDLRILQDNSSIYYFDDSKLEHAFNDKVRMNKSLAISTSGDFNQSYNTADHELHIKTSSTNYDAIMKLENSSQINSFTTPHPEVGIIYEAINNMTNPATSFQYKEILDWHILIGSTYYPRRTSYYSQDSGATWNQTYQFALSSSSNLSHTFNGDISSTGRITSDEGVIGDFTGATLTSPASAPLQVSGGTTQSNFAFRVWGPTSSTVSTLVPNLAINADGSLNTEGSISATGTIQSTSDITLKENLEIIENPIEKIKEINGYTYNMIGKDERDAGLVAQEVEKVLPEVVSENSDGIKSLAYGNIMALLVETVKEQQKQIDELKKLISDK